MYRVATRYSMNTDSTGESPLGAAQLRPVTETRRIIITVLMLLRTQTSLSRWKCARKLYPSHDPLRFITILSPLPCEKRTA